MYETSYCSNLNFSTYLLEFWVVLFFMKKKSEDNLKDNKSGGGGGGLKVILTLTVELPYLNTNTIKNAAWTFQ